MNGASNNVNSFLSWIPNGISTSDSSFLFFFYEEIYDWELKVRISHKNPCTQDIKERKAGKKLSLTEFQHIPIENVIIGESLSMEKCPKEFSQIAVVGPLFKVQLSAVCEIGGKFSRESLAQFLNGRREFLLRNPLVLLSLIGRLQSLPRQCAQIEVHQDISQWLQIITPWLFNAQMRIYWRISGSSCQILILSIWYMSLCTCVTVLLRQTKINDIH